MFNHSFESKFVFCFEDGDYREYGQEKIDQFIDELKRLIPEEFRFYFKHTQHWHIHKDYRQAFESLVKQTFKDYNGYPRTD